MEEIMGPRTAVALAFKPVTRGEETSNLDNYHRITGATVVHVALTGTAARLE